MRFITTERLIGNRIGGPAALLGGWIRLGLWLCLAAILPGAVQAGSVLAWGSNDHGQTGLPLELGEVVQIAAGGNDSIALLADGTVVTWGESTQRFKFSPPSGLADVTYVAVGADCFALKKDGAVAAWGQNAQGTINGESNGVYDEEVTANPLAIGGRVLQGVKAVAAGGNHTVALNADGTIAAWGYNGYGQVTGTAYDPFDSSTSEYAIANPVMIGGMIVSDVKAVSAGGLSVDAGHTVILRNDGTVLAWGENSYGQSDVPSGLRGVQAIAAGWRHTLALRADGTVVAWGWNGYGQTSVPAGLSGVKAIAAGGGHSVALKQDGTLVIWGDNSSGQTTVPDGLTGVTAIAAGNDHTLALVGGSVGGGPVFTLQPASQTVCVGEPVVFAVAVEGAGLGYQWVKDGNPIDGATQATYQITQVIPEQAGVYSVAVSNGAGRARSDGAELIVAIASEGRVVAWGDNRQGQCAVPSCLGGVIAIAAGESHSVALKDDGTMVAWGSDVFGQSTIPDEMYYVMSIAAGGNFTMALLLSGTVMAWGQDNFAQTRVPTGLEEVTAIAAGKNHAVALKKDGTVVAWGSNDHGQATVPAGLRGVRAIAAGTSHTVALRDDGTLTAWGDNTHGQTNIPLGLTRVVAIAAAGDHTLAITDCGFVVSWGKNTARQTDVPWEWATPNWTNSYCRAKSISAGAEFSVASCDHHVKEWGRDLSGQVPVPPGLDEKVEDHGDSSLDVRAIAAGDGHVLALIGTGAHIYEPGIRIQPTNQTITVGKTTKFTVVAYGTQPLYYYWYREVNGQIYPISGGTSDSLEFRQVQPSDGGKYLVTINNERGQITSNPFTLTVQPSGQVLAWPWPGKAAAKVPPALNGVVAIATGSTHTMALKNDGTVVVWGLDTNNYGQLEVPPGLSNVVAIGAGDDYSVALKSDGTVAAWGARYSRAYVVPPGLSGVQAIAVGRFHTLALKNDGTVVAWGVTFGGDNPGPDEGTKVPSTLKDVVAIAAGESFSLALRSDGSVVAWGNNDYKQATVPAGLSQVVAIAAGFHHCVALKADGTVEGWGGDGLFNGARIPPDLRDVKAISAGSVSTYAFKNDGSLVYFPTNYFSRDYELAKLDNVTAVAQRNDHMVVLVGSGKPSAPTILTNPESQSLIVGQTADFLVSARGAEPLLYQWRKDGAPISGATNASLRIVVVGTNDAGLYEVLVSNSAGHEHSAAAVLEIALPPPGSVVAFATSRGEQFRVTRGLTGVKALATGGGLILLNNGRVVASNDDSPCQAPASLTTVRSLATSVWSAIALLDNGSVVVWGLDSALYYGQAIPPDLGPVTSVAAGIDHFMALRGDGTVVAWGDNTHGQTNVPAGLNGVTAIGAGGWQSWALRMDGKLVGWGSISTGVDKYIPVRAPEASARITAIAVGDDHVAALLDTKEVMVWGDNSHGQTNVPSGLRDVIAIAAGSMHTVALKSDGTLVLWGEAWDGSQPIAPAGLRGVTAIAAGSGATYALVGEASHPVLSIVRTVGGLTLSWSAEFSGFSALQSESLSSDVWKEVPVQVTSSGATNLLSITPSGSSSYYRLFKP